VLGGKTAPALFPSSISTVTAGSQAIHCLLYCIQFTTKLRTATLRQHFDHTPATVPHHQTSNNLKVCIIPARHNLLLFKLSLPNPSKLESSFGFSTVMADQCIICLEPLEAIEAAAPSAPLDPGAQQLPEDQQPQQPQPTTDNPDSSKTTEQKQDVSAPDPFAVANVAKIEACGHLHPGSRIASFLVLPTNTNNPRQVMTWKSSSGNLGGRHINSSVRTWSGIAGSQAQRRMDVTAPH
jgi:hypothetical protein